MGPSPSARRFATRRRLSIAFVRVVRGFDGSDLLTVAALSLLFIGLAMPSVAFGVVGGLLILLTPIGVALRMFVRGR